MPPAEPEPSRPDTPGYGMEAAEGAPGERLPWSTVVEWLAAARNYWVITAGPDGRPHAAPVWGLWVDGALWFSSGRRSRKVRNLTANPAMTMHLESGDDVVILEGRVEAVTDRGALESFADAYHDKYAFRPDPDDADGVTFAFRPTVAFTWLEKDFPHSATRWRFD